MMMINNKKNILSVFTVVFNNPYSPPLPYKFNGSTLLKSSLEVDLSEIVIKVNELIPQLSNFIYQFNNIVVENSINVITDTNGNMSLDVPSSMPDSKAEELSKRISIIDRLITTRGQEIDTLLHKGIEIETRLKGQNPEFTSKILDKVHEFKRLNQSYKH
jgi:hypothetical protein